MRAQPRAGQPPGQFSGSIFTWLCVALCCVLAVVIARSVNEIIFEGFSVDLPRYYRWYKTALAWTVDEYVMYIRFEPLYSIITWSLSTTGISFDTFILLNKILMAASYCYFSRKIVGNNIFMLAFSIIFILSPLFSGYTENLLRQSMAYSFFLFAYIRLLDGDMKKFAILATGAALFHYSSILWSGIAFATSYPFIYRKTRIIALSVLGVSAPYLMDVPLRLAPYIHALGNLLGIDYVNIGGNLAPDGYVVGFKVKFFLASLALFAGCGAIFGLKASTPLLRKVMALALVLTAAYMLCSGFPFYDRLATVSWSFIPAVWGAVSVALLRAMGRREARPLMPIGRHDHRQPAMNVHPNTPGRPRRPVLNPRPLRYR